MWVGYRWWIHFWCLHFQSVGVALPLLRFPLMTPSFPLPFTPQTGGERRIFLTCNPNSAILTVSTVWRSSVNVHWDPPDLSLSHPVPWSVRDREPERICGMGALLKKIRAHGTERKCLFLNLKHNIQLADWPGWTGYTFLTILKEQRLNGHSPRLVQVKRIMFQPLLLIA